MIMAERLRFWATWPPHQQQRFFSMATWAWFVILVVSFGPQYYLTVSSQKQIEKKKALYARVVPIATELKSINQRRSELREAAPQELAAAIAAAAGIGGDRLSLARDQFDLSQSGVQVTLKEITLVEMVEFLKGVRDNSELHFFEFNFKRNPSNFMLADVSMLLVR